MGGTLVFRNQIGVDHRYADAGKWSEEKLKGEGKLEIIGLEKLALNQMKLFWVNQHRVVIGRIEAGFVAFYDRCTHNGGSLADGSLICGTVQCPWHGAQFDAKTGKVKAGPAKKDIRTYHITKSGNRHHLAMGDNG